MSYPPVPPVHIFVGGQLLEGYQNMTLERNKKDLTGTVSITIFFGYVPNQPVIRAAKAGAPIQVYIGGHLAFSGTVDTRGGKGTKKGGKAGNHFRAGSGRARAIGSGRMSGGPPGVTSHGGPNSYTISLKARGKTKRLVDSSHDHKTGTILNAKTRQAVEELTRNFRIALDWRAPSHDMDKVRFRAGATVQNEVHHVCNEYGYHAWESREGNLRVSDMAGPEIGEPLILGDNIMEFETEQGEHERNSEIKVQGQRTRKNMRGASAVNREKKIRDRQVKDYSPYILQHYTDASDEALERRAKFEADNRASESKKVRIKVFHVQSRDGSPWDIGQLHPVFIPTEGIADVMECISLTYTVDAQKNLSTMLTLAVPAGGGSGLASAGSAIDGMLAEAGFSSWGKAKLAELGIEMVDGQYPEPWTPADIEEVSLDEDAEPASPSAIDSVLGATVPLQLPPSFWGGNQGA